MCVCVCVPSIRELHVKLVKSLLPLTRHLAGQVLHQRDHGVFEERCGCQRPFGDFCDAQFALGPHRLQHWVSADRDTEVEADKWRQQHFTRLSEHGSVFWAV